MVYSPPSSQPGVSEVGDTFSSPRRPSFFKSTLGAVVAQWVPAASHAKALRFVHFAVAFGAILASPFLSTSAHALTLITNLGLGYEKVHDYPVYNLSKPYSSFGIGSNDIQLTSATFQLSTFSGFSWVTFNNMAISLYSSSSNGFVQGPSIATTYGSGEFASGTFDCPGQSNGTWAASRCKNFAFDLSMFPVLSAGSSYAIALSLPEDLSQPNIVYWDFTTGSSYTYNAGTQPLLSGNLDSNTASALDSLYPAKNIATAQNFYQLEGTIIPSQNASDVPGPLPILGVAAAFGFSRKLRKRIKLQKGTSAVSTSPGA